MLGSYLQLGFRHILDIQAYDHMLFLIALCAVYKLTDWKKLAVLVTAFTIGHSLTLALSALRLFVIRADIIEFLIPLTIALTAVYSLLTDPKQSKSQRLKYLIVLFFGFVHGLGFSSYFKALLGTESDITLPLFAFNLGVEIGQLVIVLVILLFSFVFLNVLKINQKHWNQTISVFSLVAAIYLMVQVRFW